MYGISVRSDGLESDFVGLLREVQLARDIVMMASVTFTHCWDEMDAQAQSSQQDIKW